MQTLWNIMNSPVAIAAIAAAAVFALNWLYGRKPAWKKWEGTIVAAVRYAEKAVPDDAQDKAVARLDAALRYVLRVHRQMAGGETPTAAELQSLREGIELTHLELEAAGLLGGTKSAVEIEADAGQPVAIPAPGDGQVVRVYGPNPAPPPTGPP